MIKQRSGFLSNSFVQMLSKRGDYAVVEISLGKRTLYPIAVDVYKPSHKVAEIKSTLDEMKDFTFGCYSPRSLVFIFNNYGCNHRHHHKRSSSLPLMNMIEQLVNGLCDGVTIIVIKRNGKQESVMCLKI